MDIRKETDGPSPLSEDGYDYRQLPDYDNDFVDEDDFREFEKALAAPENSPSTDDLLSMAQQPKKVFITALNDWRPVHQKVRRKKKRQPRRGKDETREGFVYTLLKWPLLFTVFGWLFVLAVSYLFTRLYIYLYEHWITWRGKREKLRQKLQNTATYEDWVASAKELDQYLGNDDWKQKDEYAYYDSRTIRRIKDSLARLRRQVEAGPKSNNGKSSGDSERAVDELRNLVEACVKSNFAGFENPRLYSETYYGTKSLVQEYVNEIESSLALLKSTEALSQEDKRILFKHLHTNFGRTALCLSGGATFAYYHFGVAKALLDANLLPEVITGTSGGALVAALLATRTDEELKKLLVPALANRITACSDDMATWIKRWYKTGARFDSVDWAKRCAWFTHGSLTFREAYARTGRILNVTCVPSDPHSPTILANYLTSPDCVIWSAVLASAAVPGILNPVVLMKKNKDGQLEPYSFGHKWKDGSLRTDIPLKALNLHFNVRFSIVSQVNPHINLFFFSSRGSVGRPVTHRRGRGWRGGFLGSATEQYLKLDLTKWLKVLRHLELLPRPLGQDWSEIWLQRFSGTITIWPKSIPSDFYYILTDPTPSRLARMIHVGQQSAFSKLKFISNRIKIERIVEEGRRATRPLRSKEAGLSSLLSEEDLRGLLAEAQRNNGSIAPPPYLSSAAESSDDSSPERDQLARRGKPGNIDAALANDDEAARHARADSPSISKRLSGWWSSLSPSASRSPSKAPTRRSHLLRDPISRRERPGSMFELRPPKDQAEEQLHEVAQRHARSRRASNSREIFRQSRVFIDDSPTEDEGERDRVYGEHGRYGKDGKDEFDLEKEQEAIADAAEWDAGADKRMLGMEDERVQEDPAIQKYLLSSSEEEEGEEQEQEQKKEIKGIGAGKQKSKGTFVS